MQHNTPSRKPSPFLQKGLQFQLNVVLSQKHTQVVADLSMDTNHLKTSFLALIIINQYGYESRHCNCDTQWTVKF